jgi:hypothetical protein
LLLRRSCCWRVVPRRRRQSRSHPKRPRKPPWKPSKPLRTRRSVGTDGLEFGTVAYADCRLRLTEQREAEEAAIQAAKAPAGRVLSREALRRSQVQGPPLGFGTTR